MKFSVNNLCPCGSGKKYKKCCQIFHKGYIAKDCLSLMKSRYSAFVIGDIQYIINTSTFQNDFDDLKSFSYNCQFNKLEILEFSYDTVTFKVIIFCNGVDNSFIEKSYFIKKDGKWYYSGGDIINLFQ